MLSAMLLTERRITRAMSRRRRIQRRKRRHRVKSARLRIAARQRSRRMSRLKRSRAARKALRTKRSFYGGRLQAWHESTSPILMEQVRDILESSHIGGRTMAEQQTVSFQLVELVSGGMDPSMAIRRLREAENGDKKKGEGMSRLAKGALGVGASLVGAGLLARGSYKAGKLAGSVGRKAAFLKGFGAGTAVGSVGTAATSLLHKGAQQASREAALSRHVHGTAQVPSFSFQDLHRQGHYGASGPVASGYPSPGYGHHAGAFHVPRKPMHHLPPPMPLAASHQGQAPFHGSTVSYALLSEDKQKKLAKLVVSRALEESANK